MTVAGTTARSQPESAALPTPARQSDRSQLVSVAAFFGLSLGLAVVALALGTAPAMLPFILAFGPLLIALALAWREGGGAVRRLAHSLTIRPPRAIWYLVLIIPVVWSIATVVVAIALGEPTAGLFDAVFPAMLIIPIVVLLPAITEELAWRGFALPRLLTVMSPLAAALVLAIPWTLIHVVLFFPGQWYGELAIWPLFLSITSYSVLLTWVYIGTGGSVLMTALFHAGLNGVAPVMGGIDGDSSWVIRNVLAAVIAVAVVALGGLRRTAETPELSGSARLPSSSDPIQP
jgi:membrane protease YdiL (CAAX protease family)